MYSLSYPYIVQIYDISHPPFNGCLIVCYAAETHLGEEKVSCCLLTWGQTAGPLSTVSYCPPALPPSPREVAT
jgi:hypothetical protein